MEEFSVQRIKDGMPDGQLEWVEAETAAKAAELVCGFPVGESRRPLVDGLVVIPSLDQYQKLWFYPVGRNQGSGWQR